MHLKKGGKNIKPLNDRAKECYKNECSFDCALMLIYVTNTFWGFVALLATMVWLWIWWMWHHIHWESNTLFLDKSYTVHLVIRWNWIIGVWDYKRYWWIQKRNRKKTVRTKCHIKRWYSIMWNSYPLELLKILTVLLYQKHILSMKELP